MPVQIRPTRLEVTDRFPMLGFSLRSSEGPRIVEIVLASDLALFAKRDGRNSGTFYSSREHGVLQVPPGGSVFAVPPEVLARFIAADRLYVGLASASAPAGQDWTVDVMPGPESPYISLKGLTDRALRRVRVFPAAPRSRMAAPGSVSEWAGDHVAVPPPAPAAAPVAPANGAAPPAPAPYDDGFGPLPPLDTAPTAAPPPTAAPEPAAAAPIAQGLSRATGRGLSGEAAEEYQSSEAYGIDGPTHVENEPAVAHGLRAGQRSPLTTAEYAGVTKIMASPHFRRRDAGARTIQRIVIHITSTPQRPSLGSGFMGSRVASAHYLVDQLGGIIQFVREQDEAFHARSANPTSIGIEHVAVQQGGARYGSTVFPYDPPTQIELETSAALVARLCRKYGLEPNRTTIIGHNEADPNTTHTACPTGAWDWDAYMALVTDCFARNATGGVVGPVISQGQSNEEVDPESRGIDAAPYTDDGAPVVAAGLALGAKEYDRVSRTVASPAFTTGRAGTTIDRIVIHITDAPTTSSTVNHFSAAGAQASAHYLVGQDGEIVQFVSEADTAWHAKGANRRSIGIEHVAIKAGGADYPRSNGTMQHYDALPPTQLQYEESALLVSSLCDKYGLPKTRTTIIGHNEADPNTSHTVCPTGNWDWDYFMRIVETGQCQADPPVGQGLGGGVETVEVKYRMFIPSPLIKGALSDYDFGPIASGEDFGGDGRGFSYSNGTSRGEITALVDLSAEGGLSNLRIVDRHWGQSTAYDSTYTYHVDGKPEWWMAKHAGLDPSRRATVAANDDNLRAYLGAPGTTRNILAMTSQSAVMSIYAAGALPLVSPSPDINADVSVYLKRGGNGLEVMVVGDHDGFPAHELYVNGQLIHSHDPVSAGKGPGSLFPPADMDVSTSWISIPSRAATSQSLAVDDWSINWNDVERIPQPTSNGCWATAAAMVLGWKNRQSVSPELLASCNNMDSSLQGGLAPADKRAFIDAIGLTVHPNACYTPEGFRDILEANGPVWVTADVPGIHAIVVTGMYKKDGQYFVRITDPWDRVVGSPGAPGSYADTHATGSQYIMTYDAFTAEFEAAGNIDRIQLAHSGGTQGHVANRGSASGAGYAQGLSDDPIGKPLTPEPAQPEPGNGTITRTALSDNGRDYDLAQLVGMVRPANALAGGAGTPAIMGERVSLSDWPYIDGPGGRSQAGVAIDWKFDGAAVGDIAIAPVGGSLADGWTATVKADIEPGASTPDRTVMLVRVTTTFRRAGEQDQLGVSEVTLSADGRGTPRHCGEPEATAAAVVPEPVPQQPAPAPLVPA